MARGSYLRHIGLKELLRNERRKRVAVEIWHQQNADRNPTPNDVSKRTGIMRDGVRYYMQSLVDAGYAEEDRQCSPPRYRLLPQTIRFIKDNYLSELGVLIGSEIARPASKDKGKVQKEYKDDGKPVLEAV